MKNFLLVAIIIFWFNSSAFSEEAPCQVSIVECTSKILESHAKLNSQMMELKKAILNIGKNSDSIKKNEDLLSSLNANILELKNNIEKQNKVQKNIITKQNSYKINDVYIKNCGRKHCRCPNGWEYASTNKPHGDLNRDAKGDFIYLCVR